MYLISFFFTGTVSLLKNVILEVRVEKKIQGFGISEKF